MSTMHRKAISVLLNAWNDHQDLRATGASITELNDSRSRLDAARNEATRARHLV